MQMVPRYRKSLNPKQLSLLHVIYKFRFVNAKLIAKSLGVHEKLIYFRLQNLYEQGYLDRQYEKQYRLAGKPAVYFLAPIGIRYLKGNTALNQEALHNMYFSKRIQSASIEHYLHLYDIYIHFKRWYGPKLNFFSKSELYDFDYFPKQLPDAYVVIQQTGKPPTDYMLDLFDRTMPPFSVTNKIKAYKKHHQTELFEGDFPDLLFVCDTPQLERNVQRIAAKIFGNVEDVNVYTTSLRALLEAQNKIDTIWSDAKEPERLLSF